MRHYLSKKVLVASVAMTASLALASCSAGSTSTDGGGDGSGGSASQGAGEGGDDASISIGFGAEPENLDFTRTDGSAIPQVLLYNVYEGLVQLDQDGNIVPGLAKKWTVSKDRKTYTFELVDDATFSNGKKFTAQDAKFSIDRVKSSAWTISLKSGMDVVDHTKVLSPTKLQVVLKQPSNSWLYKMTTRIGAMFSRSGVDHLATKPIGTGPYKLATWKRGDSITLTRNPDYWGDEPAYQTVTFKYFKDPTAVNNALLTGTIDVIGSMESPESLGQFENNDKYQILEGTTNGEVQLSFNNGSGPFTDKRVRQAVRYAIDHQALLDTCWAGHGKLIGSMVPPTDPWYEDLTGLYPHDLQKAKTLLKESGKASHVFRLRLPTRSYATSCGTVVKSQLEQAGFKVKIDQLEFPAAWLTQVFTNADYDMTIISHAEPRDMAAVFGDPKYYTRYDNAAFRKLLASADSGTEEQQVTDMKKAARMLSEDAAADWLFVMPNIIVADKGIQGLPKNAVTESFDVTELSGS